MEGAAADRIARSQPQPTGNPKNPFGLGDPDDLSLRKVETEILIPKKMRELARTEKCTQEEADFSECCKKSSLAMVIKCRGENNKLKSCLAKWYQDEDFKKFCTEEYLKERSEYRKTGVKLKIQRYLA